MDDLRRKDPSIEFVTDGLSVRITPRIYISINLNLSVFISGRSMEGISGGLSVPMLCSASPPKERPKKT